LCDNQVIHDVHASKYASNHKGYSLTLGLLRVPKPYRIKPRNGCEKVFT